MTQRPDDLERLSGRLGDGFRDVVAVDDGGLLDVHRSQDERQPAVNDTRPLFDGQTVGVESHGVPLSASCSGRSSRNACRITSGSYASLSSRLLTTLSLKSSC